MNEISTKELIDKFFSTKSESATYKNRYILDRRELYEYENKIGKQLVDMNEDEIFAMMTTFRVNNSKEMDVQISSGTFDQTCSYLRNFFNWYIDNIKVIRNPMNSKKIKGEAGWKRFTEFQTGKLVTNETIQIIFDKLPTYFVPERALYYECIVQLFYNGFATGEEIAMLKENMIDFDNNKIYFPSKTLDVSERCMEVLKKVHQMTEIQHIRGVFVCVPYKGGYFKFLTREKHVPTFDDRDVSELSQLLNRTIKSAANEMGIMFNTRSCYRLSFYNYLVKTYGKEKTNKMILSMRDSKETADLTKAAMDYGFVMNNITTIRKSLTCFI